MRELAARRVVLLPNEILVSLENFVVLFNIGITALLVAYTRFSERSIGRPLGGFLVLAYTGYLAWAIMA